MAASIDAVASIWVHAPPRTQNQNIMPGRGSAIPVASATATRKISANGNPNRKRTWVAPTVPRLTVSSRCIALRAVCPTAAMTVNTTQSQLVSIIGKSIALRLGGHNEATHPGGPASDGQSIEAARGACHHCLEAKGGRRSCRPLGDQQVVHIHVACELPRVGEDVVDHATLVDHAQAAALDRGFELVRRDELVPLVGAARQPAQNVFGADDGQRKALEG